MSDGHPEHPPPDYHTIQPRRATAIECIRTSAAPSPPSRSSQAFKVNGTIYVAGQIAAAPRVGLVIGPPSSSAERIFFNIEAILKAAGSSLDRVVKTTVYFRDSYQGVADFEAVYKRKLPFAPPRTTVMVSKLENTDVQMEVIAVE
ncbi:hypothetical protein N7499_002204 [Penicillium canescens]|uniref:Uncharacterized protein n=1 Tax=Penicillium canescens TaxID=5083 RepID=A0AAD6N671_PENCN|nr:uncharacterized protein N7446_009745 [Penicillium canescens]KAJ6001930.1 hypothetical protein N7522_007157 [Penicillium canescens]KAJ6034986.1 hypothetical protein N7460_009161 [Penicillium canescens]KAJ6046649.1 hypothetical protein N7444_007903 [Penicillium canescens]KAJ6053733.1 hypothetical protein N7446_009745 [Penicillium canescens]KAJ6097830.1 hypothetical protein N7499_002204 [Penicillium canescens]